MFNKLLPLFRKIFWATFDEACAKGKHSWELKGKMQTIGIEHYKLFKFTCSNPNCTYVKETWFTKDNTIIKNFVFDKTKIIETPSWEQKK